MRRLALLPLLLILLGCGQGPETPSLAQPSGVSSQAVLAALPARLGAGLAERVAPPQAAPAPSSVEGSIVRYRMPFGHATIYLFREPGRPVADGADAPPVRQHLAEARRAITLAGAIGAAARGTEAAAGQPQPEFAVAAAGGPGFRCAETRRLAGSPAVPEVLGEYVCVTGVLDRLLKLRVTIRQKPTDAEAARRYVGLLATDLAAAVASHRRGTWRADHQPSGWRSRGGMGRRKRSPMAAPDMAPRPLRQPARRRSRPEVGADRPGAFHASHRRPCRSRRYYVIRSTDVLLTHRALCSIHGKS